MKKSNYLLFVVFIGLLFSFTSCDQITNPDAEVNGTLKIDNQTHDLQIGMILYLKADSLVPDNSLLLNLSSVLDYDLATNATNLLKDLDGIEYKLDSLSTTVQTEYTSLLISFNAVEKSVLEKTTYTVLPDGEEFSQLNPYTFTGVWVHQSKTIGNSSYGKLESGTIGVVKDGNAYTFTGNLIDEDGRSIVVDYSGTISTVRH